MDVGDSFENSTKDSFALEFAASQWLKLVTDAEDLFSKLINSQRVSADERNQIECWLCLKQECDECVASDEGTSLKDGGARTLDRIDEVTEPEDHSDKSANQTPTARKTDFDSESDVDYYHPEFLDKLDTLIENFKIKTDGKISNRKDVYYEDQDDDSEVDSFSETNEGASKTVGIQVQSTFDGNQFSHLSRRRSSLHPGAKVPNMYGIQNKNGVMCLPQHVAQCVTILPNEENSKYCEPSYFDMRKLIAHNPVYATSETYRELKTLTAESDMKQCQLRKIVIDVEGAHRKINELQYTIQLKEQLIVDMIKNDNMRASAKDRLQKKGNKLEEEYYKTKLHMARAENALISKIGESSQMIKYEREIAKHKSLAIKYEKRLKDNEMMKQLAGDNTRKVSKLENNLRISKKEIDKLQKLLKQEEKHKEMLDQEILQDQIKIKELQERYKLQVSVNLNEVNARISHLEQVLKEKSTDLGKAKAAEERGALRHEIKNLRITRDCLIDQRCDLDSRFQKGNVLSTIEERKLLEYDEAIEAIDAAIEFKNELICGRGGHFFENGQVQREKGEELLIARLMKLSVEEMRSLFHKYFLKVIDLKLTGRKMECQLGNIELQNEALKWKIQELTNSLQQAHLEAERAVIILQKDHQEMLHLMLRHFTEDSSSGTESTACNVDSELNEIKQENKLLKKRLHQLEYVLNASSKGNCRSRSASPVRKPPHNLMYIHGMESPPPPTKVTRKKNKLIIQQQRSKKH